MRRDKILVVIEEKERERLIGKITPDAMPGWDRVVTVTAFPSKPKRIGESRAELREKVENDVSRRWNDDGYALVLLDSALTVDVSRLVAEGVRVRSSAHGTIYRTLLDELKKRRLHWESHALYEWQNSGIRHLHPQAWREQFNKLGFGWVAEGLLKQIRVVADAELRDALRVNDVDALGLRVAHGFVKDSDPGSSSTNIKDLLEHTYLERIFEVDLDEDQSASFSQYDVLYLYEDGLWSGVELVKRLQKVAEWTAVKERSLRVIFRFGVTSDAGLFAGRNYVRRERLTTVDIAAGIVAHQCLLMPGSIDAIGGGLDTDDESIRKALDQHACSFAFDDDAVWAGRSQEAKEICRQLGSQLAKSWLLRTKGEDGLEEKTSKWALGAFGFACMTAFAKSVPKPVLPLLWLDGPVTLNGRTESWRPLFWDARRTGAPPPSVERT